MPQKYTELTQREYIMRTNNTNPNINAAALNSKSSAQGQKAISPFLSTFLGFKASLQSQPLRLQPSQLQAGFNSRPLAEQVWADARRV